MEGIAISPDDSKDGIPDYKMLESIMEITQNPTLVADLSQERLLLLLHLLGLGLYLRDHKKLNFKLAPELEDFLMNSCSSSPKCLEQGRDLISQSSQDTDELYRNVMNLIDFLTIEVLKSMLSIEDSEIESGQLNLVEQLFSFLENPSELNKFSSTQYLLLVVLLVLGEYLNEINAIGFYLDEEITDILRKYSPTSPQHEDVLRELLREVATSQSEHTYEQFSALINYILYNILKQKF